MAAAAVVVVVVVVVAVTMALYRHFVPGGKRDTQYRLTVFIGDNHADDVTKKSRICPNAILFSTLRASTARDVSSAYMVCFCWKNCARAKNGA